MKNWNLNFLIYFLDKFSKRYRSFLSFNTRDVQKNVQDPCSRVTFCKNSEYLGGVLGGTKINDSRHGQTNIEAGETTRYS